MMVIDTVLRSLLCRLFLPPLLFDLAIFSRGEFFLLHGFRVVASSQSILVCLLFHVYCCCLVFVLLVFVSVFPFFQLYQWLMFSQYFVCFT